MSQSFTPGGPALAAETGSGGAPAGDQPAGGSVDPAEIARFTALAETWWDPRGPMRPLHLMNPARLTFIRDRAAESFGRNPAAATPGGAFAGLGLLDIGCGAGLLAEPLRRLGFTVTGIDAAARNIAIAQAHAAQSGLAIDYRNATVEALAAAGERFDVVLALEVVEHVADLDGFLAAAVQTLKPGGFMVISTLNRTARAFALAIVGAEYVLRLLPRGTHQWTKFVTPAELAASLRRAGARSTETIGLRYNPLLERWSPTRDLGVNYMMVARHAG